MTTPNEETYADFDNSELISMAHEAKRIADRHARQHKLMIHELIKRMQENNQEELFDKFFNCITKFQQSSYDRSILRKLLDLPEEVLPPEKLDEVYVPEHMETVTKLVEEKWNMSKGRSLEKLGRQVQDIINEARYPKQIRDIEIEPKNIQT
jgi:hypothetical protein